MSKFDDSNSQSILIANAIHEIRTPVQTIIGTLDLLCDTRLNKEQIEYVHQIKVGADILLALVNDLLDFSKIKSNKMIIENIPYDVKALVEKAVYLISSEAFNKNLEIVTDIDYSISPFVMGDPARVQQVLLNILKNAVKFTKSGYIHIELNKKDNSFLLFQITDSGKGIPEEKRSRLFENFYQTEASISREYGGTGLGLAICKNLVSCMKGEIGVKPNPYGGCCFWFSLPLYRVETSEEKSNFPPISASSKILITDDSPLAAENLKNIFSSIGIHDVQYSNCPSESLLLMKYAAKIGKPYDFAFIDMIMPIMNGWYYASEIKNTPLISNTKLYMLVPEGKMRSDAKMKLMDWFAGYIYKPVSREKLCSLLIETNNPKLKNDLKKIKLKTEEDYFEKILLGYSILAAEDHPTNRKLLCNFLKKYGAKVIEAENGLQAVNAVCNNPEINIIFMDIQMPVLSGIDAAVKLRMNKYSGIIIACTANSDADNFSKYRRAGINDILIKPFKRETIKSILEKWKAVIDTASDLKINFNSFSTGFNNELWDTNDFKDTINKDWYLGKQILFDYEDQTRNLIKEAYFSLNNNDFENLHRIAHTLKGSSAAISANKLMFTAERINKAAISFNERELKNELKKFEQEFELFLLCANKWKPVEIV